MSTTTVRMKAADIYKDWHVIDAAGRPLGRLAAEAAHLLRGKHKPTFEPHLDCGDFVIVVNAAQVRVGGKKAEQKVYYRHSGFPGGLKSRTFEQQLAFKPERIIEQAVWGMLPSGPLGKQMFKHLKVYSGPNHPHQSQISGTEHARTTREASVEDLIKADGVKKPRRLRPLAVPLVVGEKAVVEPAFATPIETPEVETTVIASPPGQMTPVTDETTDPVPPIEDTAEPSAPRRRTRPADAATADGDDTIEEEEAAR